MKKEGRTVKDEGMMEEDLGWKLKGKKVKMVMMLNEASFFLVFVVR